MSSQRNQGAKSPLNNRSQHQQDAQGSDPQDNIDIDVGNDDYDEETDEFANYSQQQHMAGAGDGNGPSGAGASESGQSGASGGPQNPQINAMSQSIKSNSSKGKKSQQ